MKNSLKRIFAVFLLSVVAVSFMPFISDSGSADAAGTVSMTTYNNVYKKGKTAYCAGAKGIYKVKIKKGKVKSKKLIMKAGRPMFYASKSAMCMKKKGDYIYFMTDSTGTIYNLHRVKIKTKKRKHLATFNDQDAFGYVIKGKKIYYDDKHHSADFEYNPVSVNLNGKKKKKTSVRPIMKQVDSNVKGYTTEVVRSGDYAKDYLITPKGRFYLGKIKISDPMPEY